MVPGEGEESLVGAFCQAWSQSLGWGRHTHCPHPSLCHFLHFPSTRLRCSFSAPFSLLPCLSSSPFSTLFIFRCCSYPPAILSFLLGSASKGLILASCAPWSLVALALPHKGSECISWRSGLNPFLLEPHGLSLWPSAWVPVLSSLFVPRVRHEPWGCFPISTSFPHPRVPCSRPLYQHFLDFLGTVAIESSRPSSILSYVEVSSRVFVSRVHTWHFPRVPESLFREGAPGQDSDPSGFFFF